MPHSQQPARTKKRRIAEQFGAVTDRRLLLIVNRLTRACAATLRPWRNAGINCYEALGREFGSYVRNAGGRRRTAPSRPGLTAPTSPESRPACAIRQPRPSPSWPRGSASVFRCSSREFPDRGPLLARSSASTWSTTMTLAHTLCDCVRPPWSPWRELRPPTARRVIAAARSASIAAGGDVENHDGRTTYFQKWEAIRRADRCSLFLRV